MKNFVRFLLFFVLLGVVGFYAARYALIYDATQRADALVQEAKAQRAWSSDLEMLASLSTQIYRTYRYGYEDTSGPINALRPFISNKRLPKFIRVPDGVTDMIDPVSLCDPMARILKFVLSRLGKDSQLLSLVHPYEGGHTAVLVQNKDGKIIADPYIGIVVNMPFDQAVSAEALVENAAVSFYEDVPALTMAAYGAPMRIEVGIPALGGEPLIMGEIDQSFQDVKLAANTLGMKSYWYYMGHKYDRNWTRVLKANDDLRIEMDLLLVPETGVIVSDKPPNIAGKTLSWTLRAGEVLTFVDGDAKINWKRLNSYIGVDQIRFIPLNTPDDR